MLRFKAQHQGKAQVICIGNAYEGTSQVLKEYSQLTKLYQVDEAHLGQKAAYWNTPYGFPCIVICTKPISETVLADIEGLGIGFKRPIFICPTRRRVSICDDVMMDRRAKQKLVTVLDKKVPVHLAPYIISKGVGHIANWLRSEGFVLADWYDAMPALVEQLKNKVVAHREVFSSPELARNRPRAVCVNTLEKATIAIKSLRKVGSNEVVLKSGISAGGEGVFFLDAQIIDEKTNIVKLLRARGYNDPHIEPPFIIEEKIKGNSFSPTVDIYVTSKKHIALCGVGMQRLFDKRYYAGFHSTHLWQKAPWYENILQLAEKIGEKLAEMGYSGPANIDFIIGVDKKPSIVELNPRRSALLDAYGFVTHWAEGAENVEVSEADYIETHTVRTLDAAIGVVRKYRTKTKVAAILLDGGFSSQYRWASLLFASKRNDVTEIQLEKLIITLSGIKESISEEVGEI